MPDRKRPRKVKNANHKYVPGDSIKEWGDKQIAAGRSPILVCLAQLAFSQQAEIYWLVKGCVDGKFQNLFLRIPTKQRRLFYFYPGKMWRELKIIMGPVLPQHVLDMVHFAKVIDFLIRIYGQLDPAAQIEMKNSIIQELGELRITEHEWEESKLLMEKILAETLSWIENKDFLPEDDSAFQTPAVQFFLLVFIPCMFLYGKSPHSLFKDASRGNLEAISDLLRIDKDSEYVQEIMEHVQQWRHTKNIIALKAIASAIGGKPLGKFTSRGVKIALGKFMCRLSDQLADAIRLDSIRFTRTDIYNLSRIVSEQQKGIEREEEESWFPDDIETFRKSFDESKMNMDLHGWEISF